MQAGQKVRVQFMDHVSQVCAQMTPLLGESPLPVTNDPAAVKQWVPLKLREWSESLFQTRLSLLLRQFSFHAARVSPTDYAGSSRLLKTLSEYLETESSEQPLSASCLGLEILDEVLSGIHGSDGSPGFQKHWFLEGLKQFYGASEGWDVFFANSALLNHKKDFYLVLLPSPDEHFHVSLENPHSAHRVEIRISYPASFQGFTKMEEVRAFLVRAVLDHSFFKQVRTRIVPSHCSWENRNKMEPFAVFMGNDPENHPALGFSETSGWRQQRQWLSFVYQTLLQMGAISHYLSSPQDSITRMFENTEWGHLLRVPRFSRNVLPHILPPNSTVLVSIHPDTPDGQVVMNLKPLHFGFVQVRGGKTEKKSGSLIQWMMNQRTFSSLTPEVLCRLFWETRVSTNEPDSSSQRTLNLHPLTISKPQEKDWTYLLLFMDWCQKEAEQVGKKIHLHTDGLDDQGLCVKKTFQGLQQYCQKLATGETPWMGIFDYQNWFFQQRAEPGTEWSVQVIPVSDSVLVHVDGAALTSLDWLYILASVLAYAPMAIKISGGSKKKRTVDGMLDTDLVSSLYAAVASFIPLKRFGLYDESAHASSSLRLSFPHGSFPEENPHFSTLPANQKKEYMAALRWFHASEVPEKYQPAARDTEAEVKKKWKQMALEFHPDRQGATPQAVLLLQTANPYFEHVLKIYKEP